jgi:hypothetical protein
VGADDVAPPTAIDISLIKNPIKPTAPIPKKLIFTESQSSSRPGLTASFNVLAACDIQDFMPIFTAHSRFH